MKTTKYFAIGLLLASSCSAPEFVEPTNLSCSVDYTLHSKHEQYEIGLTNYVSTSSAPGSVIGVKKVAQDAWVGASGMSHLAFGKSMQSCTPFRTGSITKVFTAVIVLQLVEEGYFSLENKVAELLPELLGEIEQLEQMQVKHLLNHSSGLGHPTDDDLNYQLTVINNKDLIAGMDFKQRLANYLFGKPLRFSPGTDSYYSNAGYWLLAWICEAKTGKSMQELMQERIFGPLLLSSSYLEKRENPDLARGYSFSGKSVVDVSAWDAADSDGDPAAGLVSNAPDLLVFTEALFTGALLSAESMEAMKQIAVFPSCGADCAYGFGIETWNTALYMGYGKNGSSLGVDANILYFPEQGLSMVLFSNYGGGNRKDVIDYFVGI